jgi:dTDP-4-dehydrorhamnose reductase
MNLASGDSRTLRHEEDSRPVWITGAGGLIGSHLARLAPDFAPGHRTIGLVRPDLDLSDFASVRSRFLLDMPRAVIHCAALSKSMACQREPQTARVQNVDVTRTLAGLAENIPFVFFSTDLVFDGVKGCYVETDPVSPISVYGETKVEAESIVLANPRHTVVRTSLNMGVSPGGDHAFNEDLVRSWKAGRTTELFEDEHRCPIPVEATARAVWELLQRGATGLFHLAGAERLSRWEIGGLIATHCLECRPLIVRGTLRNYGGPPRSPDTSLDSSKVQALLSFPLPGLRTWFEKRDCGAGRGEHFSENGAWKGAAGEKH